ncbi:MAG: hypothetical protein KDC14_14345, partial [Planctomycetes bacterium]|nr:hypothetical protein [Planctomycetota bacterium]
MRALLIGVIAGVGLSVLRAPLGVELVQFAGTTAETGFAFRAAGFALCALAVWLASRKLDGPGLGVRLFGGLALGFALHGLVLGWTPASHRGVIGVSLALLFAAFVLGRAGLEAPERTPDDEGPTRPGSALGLALVGAGLALLFELVARPLRWYGGGLPADDALFAACLLIPAAIGALAFRRALASPSGAAGGRTFGAHGAALGVFAGLWLLSSFSDPRRLKPHLARFGVDTSEHGTLLFDTWIALPVLVLAALGIGALAAGIRRREQWVALTMGGFGGTIALGRVFASDSPFMAEGGFEIARAAGVLVCVGAALHTISGAGGGRVGLRLLVGLPVLGAVLLLPLAKFEYESSWTMVPPQVLWQTDTPEGRLAVEVRDEIAVVCLDGRPLTPEREQRETERRLVHAAWRGRPEGAGKHVLVVGQVDPARASALLEVGVREFDRCAAWSESMRELEERSFAWENQSPPPGRHLSPLEARLRLGKQEYDFVYAPPVYGRAPQTRQLGAPLGVPAALAFDGAAATAERGLGPRVVPVQTGLEQLAVVIFGGEHAELGGDGVEAGRALRPERPWRTLARREDERPRFERERLARRLALANREGPAAAETRALELQLMSQERSSPFETPAERVELTREALAAWTAAGSAEAPSALVRSALEDLAVLLVSKRMVEEALEFLTPVADRNWPWPALERALALCEMELLDPAAALERLGALAEEGGVDGTDWWLLAWVQAAA